MTIEGCRSVGPTDGEQEERAFSTDLGLERLRFTFPASI